MVQHEQEGIRLSPEPLLEGGDEAIGCAVRGRVGLVFHFDQGIGFSRGEGGQQIFAKMVGCMEWVTVDAERVNGDSGVN